MLHSDSICQLNLLFCVTYTQSVHFFHITIMHHVLENVALEWVIVHNYKRVQFLTPCNPAKFEFGCPESSVLLQTMQMCTKKVEMGICMFTFTLVSSLLFWHAILTSFSIFRQSKLFVTFSSLSMPMHFKCLCGPFTSLLSSEGNLIKFHQYLSWLLVSSRHEIKTQS